MGWLSNLRESRAIRKIIRAGEEKTAILLPLIDLEIRIFAASWQCAEELSECLSKLPLTKRYTVSDGRRLHIFVEFFCFFLHFASRQGSGRHPREKVNKLLQIVAEALISSAVDVFAGHWPEDYKSRVQSETYESLNKAEVEYAACKQLSEPPSPEGYVRARFDDIALLSRLAWHVLSQATGEEIDPAQIDAEKAILADMVQLSVISKLVDGQNFADPKLPKMSCGTLEAFGVLIDRAGAAVEAYEQDGASLQEDFREAREIARKEMMQIARREAPSV